MTAMLAAQDVAVRCKEVGITALHIKIRETDTKTPGPGSQSPSRPRPRWHVHRPHRGRHSRRYLRASETPQRAAPQHGLHIARAASHTSTPSTTSTLSTTASKNNSVRRLSGTIAGVSSFNEPTAAFIAYGPDKRGGESHTISEKGCIFSGTIGIADVVSSMAAPSLGRYRESRPPAESSLTSSPVTVIPPGRAKFSRLPRQPVWCAHPCVPACACACAYRRQRLHIDADGQDGRASPTTSAVEIDRVVDDARFTKTVAARITYKNALECRPRSRASSTRPSSVSGRRRRVRRRKIFLQEGVPDKFPRTPQFLYSIFAQ
ncbi:hypothetical protein C8F04DRAFT_56302 [Mycena alexandri]|uniref:40S ribosomal protein S14 n=1 Tax=Mycena alexandri TaxID=1745969 RepID=A0AAD6X8C6_9AGAR|nr:hypothetical protein C8F04DRAFT_56302 [Mycena alexandri]